MENKQYYTPEIESLHIGYQCELLNNMITEYGEVADTRWMPYTIKEGGFTFKTDSGTITIEKCINLSGLTPNNIRTPFLSREDIIAEGWKESDTPDFFDRVDNDRWFISWEPKFHWLTVGDNEDQNGFSGKCPSVNELRFISKLLGI